ncbi:GATA transcription factor 19-like [Coffea arabica]|uniref:GATA transcription factor 19-like n=1 Tax=Coffea arabica TaxID=13443 RepID=A0ABM4V2U3_COFAR|nr:GATA transcription factor 19-like [Coffea arabica]
MMHGNRCNGGSHGNMAGPCSCGMFHTHQANSFSMLFSMPNHHNKPFDETAEMYSFASSPPSSSVDCTLSLGTPSTRLTNNDTEKRRSSYMSNFCWDILQSKHSSNSPHHSSHKSSRANSHTNSNTGGGGGLLARRCANCDTTSTPLWRNGPKGPKSLCNACGIRFKKEERRASAAAATSGTNGVPGGADSQHMLNSSWVHHSQTQKMPYLSSAYGNEFRFIDDDDRDSDNGVPFLSWRLNVTDRPSLVHDFTR